MYRRDQEQIVTLRLPENGLKGEFRVAHGYSLFWEWLWCFGHKMSFTHPI